MRPVIFDTGPLVASLCPRDKYFGWSRDAFAQIPPGCLVCEAVIAETCHLAAKEGVARARVVDFVLSGGMRLVPLDQELPAIRALLDKYADTPMDFADACVVRLAELSDALTVCTVDEHFRFFRKHATKPVPLLAPFPA